MNHETKYEGHYPTRSKSEGALALQPPPPLLPAPLPTVYLQFSDTNG